MSVRELVFKGVRHFLFEFCHLLAKFFQMSESDSVVGFRKMTRFF